MLSARRELVNRMQVESRMGLREAKATAAESETTYDSLFRFTVEA